MKLKGVVISLIQLVFCVKQYEARILSGFCFVCLVVVVGFVVGFSFSVLG